MNIFLGIIAAFLLFGMIGSNDREEQKLFTYALMTDIAAIVALHMI